MVDFKENDRVRVKRCSLDPTLVGHEGIVVDVIPGFVRVELNIPSRGRITYSTSDPQGDLEKLD